ncbi:hypothetical protein GCM10010300_11070 [Streptomyces olivaceoviridis]|uniref:hypothetical protein n=1 Tax=Streptomyces olivaceoviridis TaxID=1921 RepID=UPI00167520F2|nr:hypothetical protein [Streptomyces olivaceoviridis]GGY69673.1 hypothetical protein GCM10010300_11070 [Streptomyces olivaceoviridis]
MNHTYDPPSLLPAGGRERTYALLIGGVPLLLILLMGIVPHLGSEDGGYSDSYSDGYSGGYDPSSPDTPAPGVATAYETPTELSTDSADPTDTAAGPAGTESPEAADSPSGTVTRFFEAINEHDFQTAWDLGGKNLDASYSSFVSGFATTERDYVTIQSVQDETVWVDLLARQTDGTQKSYSGRYTVVDGVITDASMNPTG